VTYTTVEQSVADGSPIELYRFAQGTRRWCYTSSQGRWTICRRPMRHGR
jgi:GH24 family phage-related lysozyme (muramidase)